MLCLGRMALIGVFLAGLSACGSPEDRAATPEASSSEAPAATQTAAADSKPASFAQCVACHSIEPGKHGIGPSLAGVYGTKAGEVEGFAFSEPLKASGLTWDDATLDKWLAGPMKMVPGTRMSFAGISDEAKRAELIAYMKALK